MEKESEREREGRCCCNDFNDDLSLLPLLMQLLCRDYQAPAATSHNFSVSSRESNSPSLSDSNSNRFLSEPRSVSIFETCFVDLRQTLNRAALGPSIAMAVAPHRIPKTFSDSSNPYFSDSSSS